MKTIILEQLEELCSLVSISALREWCIKLPKKSTKTLKNALRHWWLCTSIASFVCVLKPLLVLVSGLSELMGKLNSRHTKCHNLWTQRLRKVFRAWVNF